MEKPKARLIITSSRIDAIHGVVASKEMLARLRRVDGHSAREIDYLRCNRRLSLLPPRRPRPVSWGPASRGRASLRVWVSVYRIFGNAFGPARRRGRRGGSPNCNVGGQHPLFARLSRRAKTFSAEHPSTLLETRMACGCRLKHRVVLPASI